jgi:GT2 family glycosyltransferase
MESVLRSDYHNFNIILIDQNSHNNSIDKIKEWAAGHQKDEIKSKYEDLVYPPVKKPVRLVDFEVNGRVLNIDNISKIENERQIILLKSKTNFGFAAGNNVCMEYAEKLFESKYYFLLNNDTVIRPNTVTKLIEVLENHPEVGAAQSAIYYYDYPERIANAGGRIFFWGQTRYYRKMKPGSIKNISFINGCALCLNSDIVKKIGMLSENFFFGEDDFEYSMRLKTNNIKRLSVADSHVFHKIGLCSDQMYDHPERKVMMFALDRMVDLKSYFMKPLWWIWRIFALGYFLFLMLFQYKISLKRSIETIKSIYHYSGILDDVKKETWENIIKGKNF